MNTIPRDHRGRFSPDGGMRRDAADLKRLAARIYVYRGADEIAARLRASAELIDGRSARRRLPRFWSSRPAPEHSPWTSW